MDKNNTCGANFSDLFKNNFNELTPKELKKVNKKEVILYGADILEISDPPQKYLLSDTSRFLCFPGEIRNNFAKTFSDPKGNHLDFEFERIPKNLRKKILSHLNKIKPIKPIQNEVDRFTKKHNIKDVVGVHVRRDDFSVGVDELGKVSTDTKFFDKMDEILKEKPDTKFLLCTDCQKTENKFSNKYSGKIITFQKKNRDRTSVINTQEGLIDLLLLSKTKQSLGTYGSTFSELAWWFGGCKSKIYMIKDDVLEEKYRFKKQKLEKSIYMKFKRFIATLLGRNSRF